MSTRVSGDTTVEVCDEPAHAVIDVRRTGADDVELAAVLRLADGEPIPGQAWLIGDPAHGIAINDPGVLRLMPLRPHVDTSVRRLLDSGPVAVPADDVPRFLTEFYPALQRQLTVESSDGSVESRVTICSCRMGRSSRS